MTSGSKKEDAFVRFIFVGVIPPNRIDYRLFEYYYLVGLNRDPFSRMDCEICIDCSGCFKISRKYNPELVRNGWMFLGNVRYMDDVVGKVSREDGEIEDGDTEDGEIEDGEIEDKRPSEGFEKLPKGKGSNSRILCNTFSLTLFPESVRTPERSVGV